MVLLCLTDLCQEGLLFHFESRYFLFHFVLQVFGCKQSFSPFLLPQFFFVLPFPKLILQMGNLFCALLSFSALPFPFSLLGFIVFELLGNCWDKKGEGLLGSGEDGDLEMVVIDEGEHLFLIGWVRESYSWVVVCWLLVLSWVPGFPWVGRLRYV